MKSRTVRVRKLTKGRFTGIFLRDLLQLPKSSFQQRRKLLFVHQLLWVQINQKNNKVCVFAFSSITPHPSFSVRKMFGFSSEYDVCRETEKCGTEGGALVLTFHSCSNTLTASGEIYGLFQICSLALIWPSRSRTVCWCSRYSSLIPWYLAVTLTPVNLEKKRSHQT